MNRTLSEVAKWTNGTLQKGINGHDLVGSVEIDSRKVEQGSLFVPLVGEHADGHQFVEKALSKGASASFWKRGTPNAPKSKPLIFVEDPLKALQQLAKTYRETLSARVVGITGSNGKTTTKDMVSHLLQPCGKVHKTAGNYNNHIGLPLTLLRAPEDADWLVVEMGMNRAGEISLLTTIAQPDVAIITNIGEAHIEYFGSREGIAQAKWEITEGVSQQGLVLLDGDEPLLNTLAAQHPSPHIETVGFGEKCDWRVSGIEAEQSTTSFRIDRLGSGFSMPVLGSHNVKNALFALATAIYAGVDESQIAEQLPSMQLSGMRMETVTGAKGETYINDAYNASPTSMNAVVNWFQNEAHFKRKIAVVGGMLELGERSEWYHAEVGSRLDASKLDYVFLFGKEALPIYEAAQENFPKERLFHTESMEALQQFVENVGANAETGILLKGSRGMRLERVLPGR